MGTRLPMMLSDGPNQCLNLDFMPDAQDSGWRFRMRSFRTDLMKY
ncbi:hypothetical protein KOEU_26700 [Komagataeibacter europaeus]|uniref:Uncharacterized protein n=1 Tax=Komagataeibacter europaeus TaxID=33995 RepID=A0A0M0EFZ3_KOMEU|nr:hypothetical protein KOEU_26700 [Komagataeibacter europaeus]